MHLADPMMSGTDLSWTVVKVVNMYRALPQDEKQTITTKDKVKRQTTTTNDKVTYN